jgi:hypothetical protein
MKNYRMNDIVINNTFSLIVFFIFANFSNEVFAEKISQKTSLVNSIEDLGSSSSEWRKFVSILTKEELWTERDAYDASHLLMIPMHYAFFASDEGGIFEFETLVSRFAVNELPGGQLNQAQWMYFVSRYLALRSQTGLPIDGSDAYLVQRVSAWLHNRWVLEPAYQWEMVPFFGSKARLLYITSKNLFLNYGYYKAITDYELFLFAIAGDISSILQKNEDISMKVPGEIKSSICDVLKTGVKIIRDRGYFTNSMGWLFQIGVWSDHVDYRFAGHEKLGPDLSEILVTDISEDASHSHRWPLFFLSLLNSPNIDMSEKNYLEKAYRGFCQQFRDVVVTKVSGGVLLKNYMDGRNGVYRYRYNTVGRNNKLGYGPYELSGILGESWYPFCVGVKDVFLAYQNSFPLSQEMLDIYTGPNTTRERNVLFRWPDYFVNGFASMQARQSAYISEVIESRCFTIR